MKNNMALEYPMFCYQCEQTVGGKGCTKIGVCSKTPEIAGLLSLGIKGMYLGPTLPAFLSPNVLQYLMDTFDLRLISNVDDDLKSCLHQNI